MKAGKAREASQRSWKWKEVKKSERWLVAKKTNTKGNIQVKVKIQVMTTAKVAHAKENLQGEKEIRECKAGHVKANVQG